MPKAKIPTNIITGFLGVGKTTAIRHLLLHKPADQRWSVLVNEFGEVGIDGAMLKDSGAFVREVPGGCICCVAGLPMKIALNMLIATTKPDRLLIEPTGLGHPEEIINTLTGEYYRDILDLRATVTLVDPRKLQDQRYTTHAGFQDQLAVADVVVANKTDLCTAEDKAVFEQYLAAMEPAKQGIYWVEQGRVDAAWLDMSRGDHTLQYPGAHDASRLSLRPQTQGAVHSPEVRLPDGQDFLRRENQGQGFYSCGWLVRPDWWFSFQGLFLWLSGLPLQRVKAVVVTDEGVFTFNAEQGVLSVRPLDEALTGGVADSRLECLDDKPLPVETLEQQLLALCHASEAAG